MVLDSRIRFGIQDVIDHYDKSWKTEILRSRQEQLKRDNAKQPQKSAEVKGRKRINSKV